MLKIVEQVIGILYGPDRENFVAAQKKTLTANGRYEDNFPQALLYQWLARHIESMKMSFIAKIPCAAAV
ncbi:hypothetical protein [Herbaspirillum sp. C9C3]|uniref:hypothetical protein n=1 Tax=Herbaspirillum sp. C9C3 TaxID=2735271 RepID=UPI001584BACD|nr:hypothetical protein [Herbaspirillum sp. C9C3]NUT62844.1 hypothetical protein [Herbaspirillum sp. C9C3]